MTASSAPLPTSPAEARTVLLYAAALAVRPIEGEDVADWDNEPAWLSRPAIALRLTPLAADWANYSDSIPVRLALGRTTARRSLGSRGFLKAVRTISTASREWNQSRRRAAEEEYARLRVEEYDRATEHGRDVDVDMLREARRQVESPLAPFTPDNDCPISWRQNGSTELLRLRRDFGVEGAEVWAALLRRYDPDSDTDFEGLLAEAQSLELDTTSPIPLSWVARVEAEDWGDDDDEDPPAAPAPVVALQPEREPETPTPVPPRGKRSSLFTAPETPPLARPLFTPRREPVDPNSDESVHEMVTRMTRERAEETARLARIGAPFTGFEPRRWECLSCGNSPRYVDARPPRRCQCGGEKFI